MRVRHILLKQKISDSSQYIHIVNEGNITNAFVIESMQYCYYSGWTTTQIAEALLITDGTVQQHIRDYKESRKLHTKNGGSCEKLSSQNALSL